MPSQHLTAPGGQLQAADRVTVQFIWTVLPGSRRPFYIRAVAPDIAGGGCWYSGTDVEGNSIGCNDDVWMRHCDVNILGLNRASIIGVKGSIIGVKGSIIGVKQAALELKQASLELNQAALVCAAPTQ